MKAPSRRKAVLSATNGWRSNFAKRASHGSSRSGSRASTSARLATIVPLGSSPTAERRGGEGAAPNTPRAGGGERGGARRRGGAGAGGASGPRGGGPAPGGPRVG